MSARRSIDAGPWGNPCHECGAGTIHRSKELAKEAGWFSRRHVTDHAHQQARTEKEEHGSARARKVVL